MPVGFVIVVSCQGGKKCAIGWALLGEVVGCSFSYIEDV